MQSTVVDIRRSDKVVPFPRPARSFDAWQSTNLAEALGGEDLLTHFQPQFALHSGELRGVEALLRIHTADGRFLDTGEKIRVAEQCNLIVPLGQHVMSDACAQFAALRSAGVDLGRLGLNVSPLELREPDYAERVALTVQDAGLEFTDLELEVTESCSLADPTLHLEQLEILASLGVSIAVDDFGSGHAAWSSVLALPVSSVKVDRAIVAKIATCRRTRAVMRHICAACRELGLEVVAEGLCSRVECELALEMGCVAGQGFGLALPQSSERLVDTLAAGQDERRQATDL